jgi:hypothetical protein
MLRMPTWTSGAKSIVRRIAHAWLCRWPRYDGRKSACASICRTDRPRCREAATSTSGDVIECSPPIVMMNLPVSASALATRRISPIASSSVNADRSSSGSVTMPRPWTSTPISSSHSSTCADAASKADGP